MLEGKDCTMCIEYDENFCKQWRVSISDCSMAKSCAKFSTEKRLNKGMQILKNKRRKQIIKRAKVKPEQENLVCFVDFSEKIIERINGKYRHPTRTEKGSGLQIKNRIYLSNGHYKLVNRSTLAITKRYADIPQGTSDELVTLYEQANASMKK